MTASKLGLPPERIARCRSLAREVSDGVRRETEKYTTVATERTVLRLLGVDGVDAEEVPIPNRAVDALAAAGKLARGAAVWMGSALAQGSGGVADAAARLSDRKSAAALSEHPRWRDALLPHVERGLERIRGNRAERERRLASHPPDERPLLYAIVATGNIHEDLVQAQAAARAGAQCIAVIRSTAQCLLDYVPYGGHDERLRRHLRDAGELPPDAGRARRDRERARPLRPPRQLLLRPLHAGDRGHGRLRAARHDAERLAVRHHLPRHQHAADVRSTRTSRAADQRGRRRHHQHRRGQLPDHRGRRREGSRRARVPVHQRAPGQRRRHSRTGRSASATPSRSIPSWRTASSTRSPRPRRPARSSRTLRSSTCRPRST